MSSNGDRIKEVEDEIAALRRKLDEKTQELVTLRKSSGCHRPEEGLTKEDILRYSRQMIVPAFGPKGQRKLKKGSVLIVGCGGLGCPAAQYLAGCGIGRLGLVDYDVVEKSNLHRQLLHSETTIGTSKVSSLSQALLRLNSELQVDEHNLQLSSENAENIVSRYDVVVDASDNVPTRYLVNDVCVLVGRPLVSGSAVSLEGQLTVYNYQGGPCYRCLFPVPPPPETVSNCGDVGVLGPVPGSIGVLQALQAVYIITGVGKPLSQSLLLFDGEETRFRTVKLRGKSDSCSTCGPNSPITKLIDYEQFCGSPANDKERHVNVLKASERLSPLDLKEALDGKPNFLLVDVRSSEEFGMCSIPGSTNAPYRQLSSKGTTDTLKERWAELLTANTKEDCKVFVICRRGNDSQLAVNPISTLLGCTAYDIVGGLHGWSREVDSTFPAY